MTFPEEVWACHAAKSLALPIWTSSKTSWRGGLHLALRWWELRSNRGSEERNSHNLCKYYDDISLMRQLDIRRLSITKWQGGIKNRSIVEMKNEWLVKKVFQKIFGVRVIVMELYLIKRYLRKVFSLFSMLCPKRDKS